MLGPIGNQLIVLVKDTSLVSAIGVMELTLTGKVIDRAQRRLVRDLHRHRRSSIWLTTALVGAAFRLAEHRYAGRSEPWPTCSSETCPTCSAAPSSRSGSRLPSSLLSTLLGIVVGTVGAVGGPAARALVTAYIFVLRGIPVLVVMFLGYYAFPAMGYRVNAYVAVGIAQIVYAGAFVAEIVRSAILSVPSGQIAAARSLGMRRRKILPRSSSRRPSASPSPRCSTTALTTIKQTSYASIVGAWELTYAAREVVERTLASFQIFLGVMAIYFVICYPLAVLSRWCERRFVVAH